MSIAESHDIYIYIYIYILFAYKMPVFTLSAIKCLKKRSVLTKSSRYYKRMVEERNVGSLQNLMSFILLRPLTHYSTYENVTTTTNV
jgi:hypothetical protein